VFVDLQAGHEELVRRMQSRNPHYMKPEMVESQLAIYGAPAADEVGVLPVNAENSVEEVIEEVEDLLKMIGA
jgi:gluconate kinase